MLNGWWPAFPPIGGEVFPCLARALLTLGVWSLCGTVGFVCGDPGADRRDRRDWHLAWLGAIVAAVSMVAAAAESARIDPAAVLQLLAIIATALCLGRAGEVARWRPAFCFAALATMLDIRRDASGNDAGDLLAMLYALFAALWLGGLLPLGQALSSAAPPAAYRSYLRLGPWYLAGMAAAALGRAILVTGGIPALIGTAYGWCALARLLSIALLVTIGLRMRSRLATGDADRVPIAWSIAAQLSLAVVLALIGALMASLTPPSGTEPVWPFSLQPSLVTIREDPDFRREAIDAILACAGALGLVAAGIVWRRARWPAIAMAAVILWFAVPHLDLLVIPAYPTSFYRSPTGFAASGIVAGGALYPENCAGCHGADGRGDGPAARGLPVPPADLTALHLWAHSDGELFWWLSHGIEAPEGGMAMPGFWDRLDEPRLWALIDFIRAHNAGSAMAGSGVWRIPVHAPTFSLSCGAAPPTDLRQLQGHVVRLVFGLSASAPSIPIPAGAPAEPVTVRVRLPGDAEKPEGAAPADGCHAEDPRIVAAYAIVSGLDPRDLTGAEFLIDPAGWLRDLRRPGYAESGAAPGSWQDPEVLLADIRAICNHPIVQKELSHAASPQAASPQAASQ